MESYCRVSSHHRGHSGQVSLHVCYYVLVKSIEYEAVKIIVTALCRFNCSVHHVIAAMSAVEDLQCATVRVMYQGCVICVLTTSLEQHQMDYKWSLNLANFQAFTLMVISKCYTHLLGTPNYLTNNGC